MLNGKINAKQMKQSAWRNKISISWEKPKYHFLMGRGYDIQTDIWKHFTVKIAPLYWWMMPSHKLRGMVVLLGSRNKTSVDCHNWSDKELQTCGRGTVKGAYPVFEEGKKLTSGLFCSANSAMSSLSCRVKLRYLPRLVQKTTGQNWSNLDSKSLFSLVILSPEFQFHGDAVTIYVGTELLSRIHFLYIPVPWLSRR
jgi:hypothetical protein